MLLNEAFRNQSWKWGALFLLRLYGIRFLWDDFEPC